MYGSGPTYEIDVHLLTVQSREPGNLAASPSSRGTGKSIESNCRTAPI
ncbi:hypothetical protein OSCI_530002 [Kamptonema sp. PCC 6506]|nr:hypothetical protein OSCI_530002 [Kamptonema sp. PCC 6506]